MKKLLLGLLLALSFGAQAQTLNYSGFAPNSPVITGGSAARSVQDRFAEILNVEDFRLSSDPVGDDTGPVQRACDAVKETLGAIRFNAQTYNIGKVTVGTEGQRYVCAFLGAGWNGDISYNSTGGTKLHLITGTNDNMIVVPSTAPPFLIENIKLEGNSAGTSGTSWGIYMTDYTTDAVKARGTLAQNVWISDFETGGIYAGTLRNAGVLDHVTVLGGSTAAIVLGSNNDWRFFAVDAGASDGPALHCTGCGSFTSTASNYFTSLNGVKMDATATDVTFLGGSIDTNDRDGAVLVGSTAFAASSLWTRSFVGVRFEQNGLDANNTYSDLKLVGETSAQIIGSQFTRGSDAATGGNLPQYHINIDGTSADVRVSGNRYQDAAPLSYSTAFSNNTDKLISSDVPFNVTAGGSVSGGTLAVTGTPLTVSGSQSAANWDTNGLGFKAQAADYTDTSSSGVVATVHAAHGFGVPTFSASSATTYTEATTLYLGTPTSGSNVAITTPYSLFATGRGKFGAGLAVTGGTVNVLGGIISLNASSNNATNIGTGTTTSAVTIGGGSNNIVLGSPVLQNSTKLSFSPTSPTISSGFGTSPSIASNNGTLAFTVNVGTGGTASSGVIGMPTATTGWICSVNNLTGVAANRADQATRQTATSTTSVTVQNQTLSTGAALAWTASDVLQLSCTGY